MSDSSDDSNTDNNIKIQNTDLKSPYRMDSDDSILGSTNPLYFGSKITITDKEILQELESIKPKTSSHNKIMQYDVEMLNKYIQRQNSQIEQQKEKINYLEDQILKK